MLFLRNRSVNGQPLVIVPATGPAPGQVGPITPGAITQTSIAVSYTAASGSAPLTYKGLVSLHNQNIWLSNGGSFDGNGGVFIGLTADVSYDLQIVVTNAVGSSARQHSIGVNTLPSIVYARAFHVGRSAASGPPGAAVAFVLTPLGGAWPSGTTITAPVPGGLSGAWDNASLAVNGTAPVSFTFSPVGGAGSSASFLFYLAGLTNTSGALDYSISAAVATGLASRYDMIVAQSVTGVGTAVTISFVPNAAWPSSGVITPSSPKGTFSPTSVSLAGGIGPLTVQYTPTQAGEHTIESTNTALLSRPYAGSLLAFASIAGTARTLAIALKSGVDRQPFQQDTWSGNAAGFSLAWAKGWGEVYATVSAIGGATGGLFIRLYDALSSGATTTAGTGTALHASPVQVYGAVSAAGDVRLLLPAGPYLYFADVATDAAFTNPVRIAQRFGVGHGIGAVTRSFECGITQGYADGSTPIGESVGIALVRYSGDARYANGNSAWALAAQGDGAGPQAMARFVAATLGVITFIEGMTATGFELDYSFTKAGAMTPDPYDKVFPATVAAGGTNNKFRWLWVATSGYQSEPETYAVNRGTFIGACDWVPKNFPACAVIGWVSGCSGHYGTGGSGLPGGGFGNAGNIRNQSVFINELEPTKPHVVDKSNHVWNEYTGGHATNSSKRLYVQTGIRQMLSAEPMAGSFRTANRGPTLASTGTSAAGSYDIYIPYTLHGGTRLQTVNIVQSNPNYTVTFDAATSTNLMSLFSVFEQDGYYNYKRAIALAAVAIDAANSRIKLTLAGTGGNVNYSDSTSGPKPSSYNVHFAADFETSGGDGDLLGGRVVMICDDQVSAPWEFGRHMRPKVDIAVSVT